MSTDKEQLGRAPDRDAELPIGDLSAQPVDAKSTDDVRGGEGVNHAEFVIVKSLDKASTRIN